MPSLLQELALALSLPSLPAQASALYLVMPVLSVRRPMGRCSVFGKAETVL